jgi:hypothetical protein
MRTVLALLWMALAAAAIVFVALLLEDAWPLFLLWGVFALAIPLFARNEAGPGGEEAETS